MTIRDSCNPHKGKDESHSWLGQYIHNHFPSSFTFSDIDGLLYFRKRRCLRVFEEKLVGESIGIPQREYLGIFATMIENAILSGLVSTDSGVFIVSWKDRWYSPCPHSDAKVRFIWIRQDEEGKDFDSHTPIGSIEDFGDLIAGESCDLDNLFIPQEVQNGVAYTERSLRLLPINGFVRPADSPF